MHTHTDTQTQSDSQTLTEIYLNITHFTNNPPSLESTCNAHTLDAVPTTAAYTNINDLCYLHVPPCDSIPQ